MFFGLLLILLGMGLIVWGLGGFKGLQSNATSTINP